VAVTADQIVDAILEREGPGTPPDYLDPHDRGGRSHWGLSEKAHPEEWTNGPPTKARARVVMWESYVTPFKILENAGIDDRLRVALIDDAVLSGVTTAKKRLQWVLGVERDGIIGAQTLTAIDGWAEGALLQAYVKERAIRLARIVEHDHEQARFIVGWISRALLFLPEAA